MCSRTSPPCPAAQKMKGRSRRNWGGASWNQHIFTDVVQAAGVLCVAYFMPPLCAGVRAESHGAFSRFSHGSPGVRPHPGLPGDCLGKEEQEGKGMVGTPMSPPPLSCLSLRPRRTVANGGELGLCFPLILGGTWGSGKRGEAGGGMSWKDRVHPGASRH